MSDAALMLALDVGGTKTWLGAYQDGTPTPERVYEGRFENSGYSGVGDIIDAFLKDKKIKGVGAATLSVACPVEDNCGALTNLGWSIDSDALKKRFDIPQMTLINDLAATAIGLLHLPDEDLHVLQEGVAKPGNRALIAAGTGLGEASLFWDGKGFHAFASEGGHTDFAPRTFEEMELLRYLLGIYGHVSYERVLSGAGLEAIYNFVNEGRNANKTRFNAAEIAGYALRNSDKACCRALDIFISIYGAEAGNLALKTLATGGVYLCGGIAPKILKALKCKGFLDAFRGKGRFEGWLTRIPVRVILNEKTALLGAAVCASRLLNEQRQTRE